MNANEQNIWFTSDTHFFHENIIFLNNRPYKSVQEMNEDLIHKWNTVVGLNDIVYHLGDVGMKCSPERLNLLLKRLNGKIHLIKGNHDKAAIHPNCKDRFETIKDYDEIRIDYFSKEKNKNVETRIILFHYPIMSWNGMWHRTWHLYGHVHGQNREKLRNPQSLEVGVDICKFKPLNFFEVKDLIEKQIVDKSLKVG